MNLELDYMRVGKWHNILISVGILGVRKLQFYIVYWFWNCLLALFLYSQAPSRSEKRMETCSKWPWLLLVLETI